MRQQKRQEAIKAEKKTKAAKKQTKTQSFEEVPQPPDNDQSATVATNKSKRNKKQA